VPGWFRARGFHGEGQSSQIVAARAYFLRLDSDGDGLPDLGDPDDDGDGMFDTFEIEHGFDPLDPSDGTLDPDGDGLANAEEFAEDPDLDPFDPDTDGDGIDDRLDDLPTNPNNQCTDGAADNAIVAGVIATAQACAATASITVLGTTDVLLGASLRLVSPVVRFHAGFRVKGGLSVLGEHPCAACSE
jgi:hypothetical protein